MALHSLELVTGWKFFRGLQNDWTQSGYDDSSWLSVRLPHDWCVGEKFTPDVPGFARSAWLPQGVGCYRIAVPPAPEFRDLRTVLCFEGVAGKSTVWVNDVEFFGGDWPFAPVEIDLSEVWRADAENRICVRCDQSDTPVCRWYAGAGLFRSVRLEFRAREAELPPDSFFVRTSELTEDHAVLALETNLANRSEKRLALTLRQEIISPDGTTVYDVESPHCVPAKLSVWFDRTVRLEKPLLWSPDSPALYTFRNTLLLAGKIIDRNTVRFGVRKMTYDAETGFHLNGQSVKLNGVCLHNDLGALGAACEKAGILRQLRILKGMGCNAIRTAHNPFNREFLDACDEMGMLVLAELFDEWQEPQLVGASSDGEFLMTTTRYYWHKFDRRAIRDTETIVRRDRNHASIILWSIGNEVKQMYKFSGYEIAGRLQETIHNLDDSRAVTCAVVVGRLDHRNIGLLDVGGYNYPSAGQLDEFHRLHPGQPMLVTECYSAQTRRPLGMYLPAGQLPDTGYHYRESADFIAFFEHMESGLDAWRSAAERPFVMGSFLWTGFDYLGETTPYDYPSHSSYFGVIDLCGFPKDGYYFYRSVWRPEPLVHLAAAWDFSSGERVDVGVISNCENGSIFRNGERVGSWENGERIHFETVDFQPGELRAVGYDRAGREIASDAVRTSSPAASIRLTADSNPSPAPGELVWIACEILDARGERVRNAAPPVTFEVVSNGSLFALDNGLQTSTEPFQNTNLRHACAGRCLAVVRTGEIAGMLKIKAVSPGLSDAVLELPVRG